MWNWEHLEQEIDNMFQEQELRDGNKLVAMPAVPDERYET